MAAKVSGGSIGKPIRCRAAVCRRPSEPLVIEEIIVAPPMPHEVRIRIIYTSLCHSDVLFWKIEDYAAAMFPRILGHEAIGVVESLGEDVNEVSEGDTVIPTFVSECGECRDCKSPKSNLCSKLPFKSSRVAPFMPRYETSRFTDLNGEAIYHFLSVSSFSEYTVVDIAHVTKIDSGIPLTKAAGLLGCGISTGVGAACRTANIEPGSTVAIFGLGSVGLAVAEGARLCGATRIIGVDVNKDKFEVGKKFGLTDFVESANSGSKSASEVIIEMTDGGADYCFECVGMASLVQEAYACCRKGWGETIVLGVDKPGSQVSIPSKDILTTGKSLIGAVFGGLKPKSDIPILLNRYINKELQLDEFVTHEVTFEDINKAFDLLIEGKSLKCVICMDDQ
ncbi:alcohol dehydrogenase-like 7 isoform X2 [Argentina anserina]|uniref:alcohol dehydrogenase-like 7 isoform X2 n=1 Tax=Argentina anserina TaxID=57926 RepID=UPI0021763600|nr:alcohol dehydrogenase-like 7 isoform X2 [Potentilla anserina]XP_050366658.1 alcohol dehydrogenase-like 7 isoform X2 [Potentilla anserina]